jgi:hypothetical protein
MLPHHQFVHRAVRGALAPTRMRAAITLLIGIALAAPPAVRAQHSGDGFLFTEPRASLTLRGGFAAPREGSDIFSYSTREYTLGRDDFDGPALGLDLALRLSSRLDLVLGTAYAGTSARSEYRDFLGDDDLPIEQTTIFRRVPVTASIKAYLMPRGRSIGRFAWIPPKWAPDVGAGGGAVWYRFGQRGEFVNFETKDIVRDELVSSGWVPTVHALAGFDISLTPRFALTTEGRYSWAKATLSDDFQGFQKIDLAGLSTTLGIQLRF